MTTFLDKWRLQRAVTIIKTGGVIAYPTEAVYGLGCDPFNHAAVDRIMKIKRRSLSKGLILIAETWEQVQPFVGKIDAPTLAKVKASWPGPITWVLPASERVPPWIRGEHATIALRVTDHPVAKELCHHFGNPIVSTSANIAEGEPLRTFSAVKRELGEQVDFILKGRMGKQKQPTEIRDAITDHVIRVG
jgi:L-threonylcarbamoyladenylate synthase